MKENLALKDAYQLLHRGTLALARAERQGIRVDMDYIRRQKLKLTKKIEQASDQFQATDFFKDWQKSRKGKSININSNQQLRQYLYKTLKYSPSKETTSGQGSTDFEALQSLNIKELDLLLQMRKWVKIRDTYLESFSREEVNGYIHPFFNLHTVTTYRSSSADPNFQNIPVRDKEAKTITRRALYPRPGHQILEVDYGSLEVRVSCCYHKDPNMIAYVKDKSTDMHRDMAEQIFKLKNKEIDAKAFSTLRASAKNSFVFPQFYGDYFKNCAIGLAKWMQLPAELIKDQYSSFRGGIRLFDDKLVGIGDHLKLEGIVDYATFEDHLQRIEKHFWNKRFTGYRDWKEEVWEQYQRQGYLDTLTGFRLTGAMRKNELLNAPIQGSAFHCTLWSLNELDRLMLEGKWDTKIIGQIHDSLVFDVHPSETDYVIETVQRVTCVDLPKAWKWIIVPFEVEAELAGVDESWYNKKKIKLTE